MPFGPRNRPRPTSSSATLICSRKPGVSVWWSGRVCSCFGLVLEKIPAVLGTRVSQELEIPTIGIGAGGGTDGQVLVIHDMLGINNEFSPRFLRRYADLYTQMMTGVSRYVEDVKSGDFPSEQEQY